MHKQILLMIVFIASFLSSALQAEEEERLLLIIGCARSGTTYIAHVLHKCGLEVLHERMGKEGASSWFMTIDTDTVPWGDIQPARNGTQFQHIFHQVRDPLKVISSVFSTETKECWDFIMLHIPQIHESDDHLLKCAKYWYYWNLKAEEQAEWTYRIEDLENEWAEFQRRLGRVLPVEALTQVPTNTNTRPHAHDYTWNELKAQLGSKWYKKVRKLAQRYGYVVKKQLKINKY